MNQATKNIVVERDYTADLAHMNVTITQEDKAIAQRFLSALKRVNAVPHTVDKRAAASFDRMVLLCDSIAKEFSGKLKAVVDFEDYTATIELECVCIEFMQDEFMSGLKYMTETALHISFYPLTSGFLRLTLSMPYFTTA